jgi:hypothetical protein
LAWTATPNATNPVINSAFDIWQRGTSVSLAASTSIANSFTADRFQMPTNANQACTVSRQATGDTTNLPNIQYAARFQRNSGQTGTGTLNPSYNLESADSIPFAGKTITFSFYARAGANYSNASSTLRNFVVTGTGSDQNLQNGYTGQATLINNNVTLTTTLQRFTATATVPITATQIGFYFQWIPVGTAGANDYFEVTGIMINVGSTALPYRRNSGSIQGELAACQRYYQRFAGSSPNPGAAGYGYAQNNSSIVMSIPPLVPMRITPSAVDFATLLVQDNLNNLINVTSVTIETNVASPSCFAVTVGSSAGYTAGRTYRLLGNASTAYVGFNAEL